MKNKKDKTPIQVNKESSSKSVHETEEQVPNSKQQTVTTPKADNSKQKGSLKRKLEDDFVEEFDEDEGETPERHRKKLVVESDSDSDEEDRRKSRTKFRRERDDLYESKKHRRRDYSRDSRKSSRKRRISTSGSDSSDEESESLMKIIAAVQKQMKNEKKQKKKKRRSKSRERSRSKSRSRSRSRRRSKHSPDYRSSPSTSGKKQEGKGNARPNDNFKSPSDTSLYAPAVAKDVTSPAFNQNKGYVIDNSSAEFITDFIKKIRIADRSGSTTADSETERSSRRPQSTVQIPREKTESEKMMEKRKEAENQVLQAEQYKANLIPQGKIASGIINNQNLVRYAIDPDDEFFHITCHIDGELKLKIRKGEFVELEKLLNKKLLRNQNSDKMDCQIVTRGGESFIVPKERETKINSIHKWDQAFRIYAAIYAKANPERAVEIWQYIETIHTAANTFSWDCVANYDYTFRQLMAEYPQRSWAKIYSQVWNLNLCTPQSRAGPSTGQAYSKSRETQGICWRYNKNKCKYGQKCRFDHRCSNCGLRGHPSYTCNKRRGSSSKSPGSPSTSDRAERSESRSKKSK